MATSDRKRTENPQKASEQSKKPARDDKSKKRSAETKRRASSRRDASRKGSKSRNAILRYFQETGDELRKVAWPTREQAIRLTVIVLGSTIATAMFFGILDWIFQRLAGFLI
ncbi:MAG: preprotein translocase subunit SecE [Anaerolineae bacterium]|nr:preprotein translocase subunit SecE [Anaerolineae bacterium]